MNNCTCDGIDAQNITSACNGHGVCVHQDKCFCGGPYGMSFGYYGDYCERYSSGSVPCGTGSSLPCNCLGMDAKEYDSVCSGHGVCYWEDSCDCESGYGGDFCDIPIPPTTCGSLLPSDPNVCSGHGHCADMDFCYCHTGYYGENCENQGTVYCDGFCGFRGICIDNGVCNCPTGWSGTHCHELGLTCFDWDHDNTGVCSGNGDCVSVDRCVCDDGFSGMACQRTGTEFYCYGTAASDDSVCSGNGICAHENVCACDNGFYGATCGQTWSDVTCGGKASTDPMTCSGHGICVVDEVCLCLSGWLGETCYVPPVTPVTCSSIEATSDTVCSGNGICVGDDICVCDPNYYTSTCEKELPLIFSGGSDKNTRHCDDSKGQDAEHSIGCQAAEVDGLDVWFGSVIALTVDCGCGSDVEVGQGRVITLLTSGSIVWKGDDSGKRVISGDGINVLEIIAAGCASTGSIADTCGETGTNGRRGASATARIDSAFAVTEGKGGAEGLSVLEEGKYSIVQVPSNADYSKAGVLDSVLADLHAADNAGLTAGEIAGIVIGSLAGLAGVVVVLVAVVVIVSLVICRNKNRKLEEKGPRVVDIPAAAAAAEEESISINTTPKKQQQQAVELEDVKVVEHHQEQRQEEPQHQVVMEKQQNETITFLQEFLGGAKLLDYVDVFAEAEVCTLEDLEELLEMEDVLEELIPKKVPRARFVRAVKNARE